MSGDFAPHVPIDGDVVDVGANVGDVTEILAPLCRQGRLLAIEPGPKAFEVLSSKFPREQYPWVTLLRVAVAEGSFCSRVFHHEDWTLLPDGHPDQKGHVYPPGSYPHLKQSEGFEVDFISLDKLLRLFDMRPAFVKVDVDGMELRALKGMLDTIDRHRPTIVIEVGKYTMDKVGDSVSEMARLLLHIRAYYGYEICSFIEPSEVFTLETPILARLPEHGTHDFLLIPKPRT